MNGIFKESTLVIIDKIKKGFLWAAVCFLIGGLVLGAILLLTVDKISSETFGLLRILATVGILTLVLFVGVNNLIRMEKGTRVVQSVALMGLISGVLAAILGMFLIWDVIPSYDTALVRRDYCTDTYNYNQLQTTKGKRTRIEGYGCDDSAFVEEIVPSATAIITSILVSLAGMGFWVSNVLSIKETTKVVKPLKITSVACELYCTVYGILLLFPSYIDIPLKMAALSGFAVFAFVVTALAAWIISKTTGKKVVDKNIESNPRTDEELRAEIEEKVRREMIEKEVREKMEREMREKTEDGGQNVLLEETNEMTVMDEVEPIETEPIETDISGTEMNEAEVAENSGAEEKIVETEEDSIE